ncbi:hypothetical protein, partial [Aeromonas hydrophila]|uniref:hypothetical protein n=1 Tax=Aeromonas hydrophila TaxID=644 RepID=UPI002258FE76
HILAPRSHICCLSCVAFLLLLTRRNGFHLQQVNHARNARTLEAKKKREIMQDIPTTRKKASHPTQLSLHGSNP